MDRWVSEEEKRIQGREKDMKRRRTDAAAQCGQSEEDQAEA